MKKTDEPTVTRPPNIVVELRLGRRDFRHDYVVSLIAECKSKPESFSVFPSERVAAALNFREWVDAADAVVWFWESRLSEVHDLTAELTSKNGVPREMEEEVEGRLRRVFGLHVKGLMEGKEVKRWLEEKERLSKEIESIARWLSDRLSIFVDNEQKVAELDVLEIEENQVEWRIKEFRKAMECVLQYLENNNNNNKDGVAAVFRFDDGASLDWNRFHCLIIRERRRLQQGLRIYSSRTHILQEILAHQVMVLIGDTGSGKSTQLVQFLADSGIGGNESIVCTQTRKIAANLLAQRVMEESRGCYEEDNNSIRCYSTFSSLEHQFGSRITFMTEDCLLQHYTSDKNLSGISCIIIDEAHERTINTDLLLPSIKILLRRRVEMRLIIMSATTKAKELYQYFFGRGYFHMEWKKFPVDVRYVPSHYTQQQQQQQQHSGSAAAVANAPNVSDVVRMAIKIHRTEKEGNILAFLTSHVDVEWACEKFEAPSAVALPLHGKLSSQEQFRVFQNYPGKRKVIFATNLAETSLTIPGVKYVIDSGFFKDCRFDPGSGKNVVKVCWISQSSALQRAGRAGITESGRCYRLYSEVDYRRMKRIQEPEIHRVHLGVAVLRILALGFKNVQDFHFLCAPSPFSIEMAIGNLIQLGVITLNNNVHELTHEGRCLVTMGIEPRLGELILDCFRHDLGAEGNILAALMAANPSSIF